MQQSLAATVPINWACYCMHVQNNDKQQNNYHPPEEETACIVAYLGNSHLLMSHQVANIHHCTTAVIHTKQMPTSNKPGSATFFPLFSFQFINFHNISCTFHMQGCKGGTYSFKYLYASSKAMWLCLHNVFRLCIPLP